MFKEILSKIFQITDSDNNKSSEIFWLVCEKSFTFWNSIVLYLILKLLRYFFCNAMMIRQIFTQGIYRIVFLFHCGLFNKEVI